MDVIKEEHECDDKLYSECSIKNEECVVPDIFPVVRTGAKVSKNALCILMEKYHLTLHITPSVLLLQMSAIQEYSIA